MNRIYIHNKDTALDEHPLQWITSNIGFIMLYCDLTRVDFTLLLLYLLFYYTFRSLILESGYHIVALLPVQQT